METTVTEKPQSKALVDWDGVAAKDKWDIFQVELRERETVIAALLPENVSLKRFMSMAVTAAKQNPQLLSCTKRSLFTAITQSAQDGLLPDGKEGVITAYNEKQRDGTYALTAKWNPMSWGLRKRARELDGIIVDAQPVYANDEFDRDQGDAPMIIHRPPPLGQDRGALIGAYAIFRKGDEILHREVMDASDIEKVKQQSRAQTGLLWTTFEDQAWRKTVLRRGFKSVPCSEHLERIVRRDDDLYTFDTPALPEPKVSKLTPPTAPPAKVAPSPGRTKAKGKKRSAKSAPYAGEPAPQTEAPSPKKDAKKPPKEEGGAFYSDDDSGAHLDALVQDLEQPMSAEDLLAFVKERRATVSRLIPPHQKHAQSRLDARAKEILAEGTELPRFIEG